MLTREQVIRVLAILGDAYPSWADRSSETLPETWRVLLGDLPIDRLLSAAIAHAQSSHYPPTVAELRARAERRSETAPEEAWALCVRAASFVSPYSTSERFAELWRALETKDAAAAEALRSIGGFSLLHTQLAEDVSTNRAHFARAYQAILERSRRDAQETKAQETLGQLPQLRDGSGPRRIQGFGGGGTCPS